jgi:hypothetical protein
MCRKITDAGIKALVNGGSALQWINVYDCTLLTAISLQGMIPTAGACPTPIAMVMLIIMYLYV